MRRSSGRPQDGLGELGFDGDGGIRAARDLDRGEVMGYGGWCVPVWVVKRGVGAREGRVWEGAKVTPGENDSVTPAIHSAQIAPTVGYQI